eukprot:GGOE01049438.1.p1 GENE.GGOE01049438.1~~GGOE01049438.1.p1  ORF type:complete len:245 (+),score=69.81 GGOE01049438.1:33-737(+)
MSDATVPPTDWTPEERAILDSFHEPEDIQVYLDSSIKYSSEPEGAWSPRFTMRTGKAHCFGGALFAAAALKHLGFRPALLHINDDTHQDDDHVIAIYQRDGYWGSVSKSNFLLLRGRQPVYQSSRELAMTYFDVYTDISGKRSMTDFSDPVWLEQFEDRGAGKAGWQFAEENMEDLDHYLTYIVPHHTILPVEFRSRIHNASPILGKAACLDTDVNHVKKETLQALTQQQPPQQ